MPEMHRLGPGLALFLSLAAGCTPSPRVLELPENGEWSGTLELEADARLDFRVTFPPDTVRASLRLQSDVAQVDLHAHPGMRPRDLGDALYLSEDSDGAPQIDLDRLGPDRLGGETWHVAVHWPFDEAPRTGDRRVEVAHVRVEVESFRARVDGELEPGIPTSGWLDAADGGFRSFRVQVPEGARALRIDLSDVESDLDLYARAGGPVLAFDDTVAFAEHNWGRETLLVRADSQPPLVAGEWRIDVQDALGPTRRLPFTIEIGFDARVPDRLRRLPVLAAQPGENVVARAARAVVELATPDSLGSGTLVSAAGWILTNAHVVGDDPEVEVVVSLLVDAARPAEECLRARVVRVDFERDLALLKVVSDLYGESLPAGFLLPALERGEAARLSLGDPLWLVGYPATGGTGSRVTISATRGVVSGFERADFGRLVKTDAEITRGNSGGAALDERGLLIGVPSSTVENGSGQIGFVHPIDALPAEWLRLIGR